MMKDYWTSKTLWANVLTLIATAGITYQGDLIAMFPHLASYITTGLALVNVALRLITNKGIKPL